MNLFKIILAIIIYSLLFTEKVHSQSFAPLNLGNVWVWEDEWGNVHKSVVIDTNYFYNNYNYTKIIVDLQDSRFKYAYYNNTDSLFYQYQTILPYNNGNIPYYKNHCILGDSFSYPIFQVTITTISVIDIYQASVFDTTLQIKILHENNGGLVESFQAWTDEIGCLSQINPQTGTIFFKLKGCVINSRVYGDTSLTVGIDDSPFIKLNFKLYQNYPNPFNPSTNIDYELKEYAFVNLKVYDILGNEVAVLVDEEKYAGKYSSNFNGTGLTSGIYFYKLTVGGNTLIRKMILLR